MIDRVNAILMKFKELYGSGDGIGLTRAPGRVNLIGEHTDYNEGFVLPVAIGRDTTAAFKPNGSRTVNVWSMTNERSASFSLDDPKPAAGESWSAYVAGVAHALQDEGLALAGIDAVIHSTLPMGGGLSSSAALEVSSALAFLSAAGLDVERKRLARICQAAESKYVGMRCGIMDQYVALFGEQGHAVKIDCRSVTHEMVPLATDVVKLVVCDTGVRHQLASSEYNHRRAECEQGVRGAVEAFSDKGILALRDLTPGDLPELEGVLDPVVFKRVRHVVTEDARVLDAMRAMRSADYITLGVLMDASHESLRLDYEVSCPELDAMVEMAWEHRGVFGSRMTGGGFGGCTVTLVSTEHADAFCRNMAASYQAKMGRVPSIYLCAPERGAEVIRKAE